MNSLSDDLRKCFHAHNISQNCITDLLGILRRHGHLELPNDARSLMRTPRCLPNVVNVRGGQYVHFGLEESIKRAIVKYNCTDSIISFNINIDGLPICKSSGSQFWPILGDIVKRNIYTELATQCSWFGQRGNYKTQDLYSIKILRGNIF